MKTVAYIHGFNSSSRSFAYVLKSLPSHNVIEVNYMSHQCLSSSIKEVLKQLPKTGELSIVGHSLGGVIGTLIADQDPDRVSELVTISSPLGGSRAASIMRWVPGYPLVLSDLTPSSEFIVHLKKMKLKIPTLSIYSTGGHMKTSTEPNDSIVAVSSQKALSFGKKLEVKANHFEVLMHEKTIQALESHVFGGTQ